MGNKIFEKFVESNIRKRQNSEKKTWGHLGKCMRLKETGDGKKAEKAKGTSQKVRQAMVLKKIGGEGDEANTRNPCLLLAPCPHHHPINSEPTNAA